MNSRNNKSNSADIRELEQRFPRKKVSLPNGEILSYVDCSIGNHIQYSLLVIPGYGCDAKYMAYTLAEYPAFCRDHRIIAVDPRGYGESTNVTPIWSHEENADDVKLVMDQLLLGISANVLVMGYSTGAAVRHGGLVGIKVS